MDVEKKYPEAVQHHEGDVTSSDIAAHIANQEDHEISKWHAIKSKPWAFVWCLFAVWTTMLVSFENNASAIVRTTSKYPLSKKNFDQI